LTKPVEICGIKFRSDHPFEVNFYDLHHNPEEWIKPNEFIPERFDP
jgi:cytochrome P450